VTTDNNVIRIFSAENGQVLGELHGHDAGISALVFGPNGTLYSGDRMGVIRSWDLEAQREQWHFSVSD
jgi:WD40 repeat protein